MNGLTFQAGSIVKARGREWIVLPKSEQHTLHLRPLGGSEEDSSIIYLPLEKQPVESATFPLPTVEQAGTQSEGLLLRDALMLKLRNGAGPFRSFGFIAVEPRAYQLVPLLMALKLETVRLLIADDVGIGKTIEAGLIAREMLDRGGIQHITVLCPPHLCDQWKGELANRFHIDAVIVRTNTAARLERGLPAGASLFTEYPFTIISLDYIKNKKRRDAFAEQCPEFVIVDEAHTCSRTSQGRQLRFELLNDLASKQERHLLMLTATPHSGDEDAFYNLISLLKPEFIQLKDVAHADHPLRKKLAEHFIQRRRQDIREWQEGDIFPERYTKESTYKLTGEWGALFQEVLDYARELANQETKKKLQQRMNWWAALALLRCISSSPAAAVKALNTRLLASNNLNYQQDIERDENGVIEDIDSLAIGSIFDGDEEGLGWDDIEPAAAVENSQRLTSLIERAERLKSNKDPKLQQLIKEIKILVEEDFKPVVFCRYIATAHYLAEEIAKKIKTHNVVAITGELTPAEREERIESFKLFEKPALLIATDCLSEGINLQDQFTAVVHYDLSWNPTRHEQREGRIDRFGQQAKQVKALMLYGHDNPIDGAVLQVILRKAESIRKALGVSVPMPEDDNKITQAIMEAVLIKGKQEGAPQQFDLFSEALQKIDNDLEKKWDSAREKTKKHRTIFAQNRLKPEDVLPEWKKTITALGGEEDVARFVMSACQRLGAPLTALKRGGFSIPLKYLPLPLQERLEAVGMGEIKNIAFKYPVNDNAFFIHRTHPLVSILADNIAEQAMSFRTEHDNLIASRCGAIYTQDVSIKTTIYLLRIRSQLSITRGQKKNHLLAEEAIAVAVTGDNEQELLSADKTITLLQAKVHKNMEIERRDREINQVLTNLVQQPAFFNAIAETQAKNLLNDHRRIKEAADDIGRYTVKPQLPVDVLGVYILVPSLALF